MSQKKEWCFHSPFAYKEKIWDPHEAALHFAFLSCEKRLSRRSNGQSGAPVGRCDGWWHLPLSQRFDLEHAESGKTSTSIGDGSRPFANPLDFKATRTQRQTTKAAMTLQKHSTRLENAHHSYRFSDQSKYSEPHFRRANGIGSMSKLEENWHHYLSILIALKGRHCSILRLGDVSPSRRIRNSSVFCIDWCDFFRPGLAAEEGRQHATGAADPGAGVAKDVAARLPRLLRAGSIQFLSEYHFLKAMILYQFIAFVRQFFIVRPDLWADSSLVFLFVQWN